MDSLLAEISAKKRVLAEDGDAGGSKKYMRRADIERAREEEESRVREAKREAERRRVADVEGVKAEGRAAKMRKDAEQARLASLAGLADSRGNTPEPGRSSPAPATVTTEGFNISPEECIRRLRTKGQPIRLFGESDKERRLRLRALELLEDRGGGRENDFRKMMDEMERGADERDWSKKAKAAHQASSAPHGAGAGVGDGAERKELEEKRRTEVGLIDLKLIKTDPNKLFPLVYYAFKNLMKEWEDWMENRPEEIKRTGQGKMAAAIQVSSAQNLKPLFKQLRSRELAPDVVRHLAEIIHHAQTRHYQKANDAYLRMSIGNAAWPIGVTSVGIHERSARETIGQDRIAHVLNDEVSRKYIQAVKRLLTFSQTVRPPDDASQLMG